MAHGKAWVVLAEYPSSSSNRIHQVRRGGDGVLYCICPGWAHSKSTPKTCTHTKNYVSRTGAAYYVGPNAPRREEMRENAERFARASRQAGKSANFDARVVANGTSPAGADWRAVLLAEKSVAASAVRQAPDAFEAYARELDLD